MLMYCWMVTLFDGCSSVVPLTSKHLLTHLMKNQPKVIIVGKIALNAIAEAIVSPIVVNHF